MTLELLVRPLHSYGDEQDLVRFTHANPSTAAKLIRPLDGNYTWSS